MADGSFLFPLPPNEPVLSYKPGSPEKALVKAELKRYSSTIIEIPLAIGGQLVFDRPVDDIYCPHEKSKVLARSRRATAEDTHDAIAMSLEARKSWSNLPWNERAAVFLKAAELLSDKYRASMNAITMLAQSKTIYQAEIDAACELIDFFRFNVYYLERIYREQPPHSPNGIWNRSEARGLEGFVFAIGPFNFSSISVNLAFAPALMGCSVIWKPAPAALPASWLALEILHEAGLPKGVINLLSGDASLIGDICLSSKDLSGIHFTGSTQTFNHLWKTVGNHIGNYRSYPRIVGETGGKDFVFAHPNCDYESMIHHLIRGAFEYQGQKCSAASRAYIPKSLWPTIKPKLIALTNAIKVGTPDDFRNFVSAVIDQRSFDKIKSFINHAKASPDAEIIAGGECDDSKGFFIRPTIIEAQKADYRSMIEEIFGPVLTVFVYEDHALDQTLAICDQSTRYSLTGAIFAKDRGDIAHMTLALKNAAGNFYINDKPTGAVVGQQPFGGSRASGTNDKAGSMFNLLRWVNHRTIKENFLPLASYHYPFMDEN
jgi:1-pyrroline-5-carboxylate dehydrogenase